MSNFDVIDIGEQVVCDLCNKDYTDSDEQGGFMYGSSAICPNCAPRIMKEIKKLKEEKHIKKRCPAGMSFKDFVLDVRQGDNRIIISSF